MFKNVFNRFFPIPAFLSMPSFGLDISDESVKYISFATTKNGLRVDKYGERKVPAGAIEAGKIKDPKKLEEILNSIRLSQGIKSVRVSLPEEQVYLFQMKLDKIGLVSVREGIELSMEEHIPIPVQDAIFDYEILGETSTSLDLQVAAIPKNVIDNYLAVFKNAEMLVPSFELEAQAISRSVIKRGDLDTYMIVDFGDKRTGIFIVSRGVVRFTSTLDVGGIMLTAMIAKSFNLNTEEAEKMKIEYGLQRNVGNKEIFAVLLNSVSVLRDEIVKHFLYWQTHQDEVGNSNPPIKKIILCGGESNLIGLADYLSVSTKSKVEIADVWVNVLNTEDEIPEIDAKIALSFATAIGLALGNFEHD